MSAGVGDLSDQGIPVNERLQVPTGLSTDPHTLGVLSAAQTMARLNRHTDTHENKFLATAAYMAVSTGMVYKMKRGASQTITQGSDWEDMSNIGPEEAQVRTVEGLLKGENYSGVMTLCLATKYSWWTMNHHMGQGGWSPYVLKVAHILGEGYATEAMKAHIHRAGHWMGTHQGLRYFGIYTPALMKYVVEYPTVPVIADDFVLRQTSCPVSSARACVVDAGFRLTKFEYIKDNVTWVQDMNEEVTEFKKEATD